MAKKGLPVRGRSKARLGIFALGMLVFLPGRPAEGQVAIPVFAPTTVRMGYPALLPPQTAFVSPNPAAIHWGAPSVLGGGILRSTQRPDPAADKADTRYRGSYGGLRLVSELLAFAASHTSHSSANPAAGITSSWQINEGALSFQFGGHTAIGAGKRQIRWDILEQSAVSNTTQLGFSHLLNPMVAIAASIGKEQIAQGQRRGERYTYNYGIAHRSGGFWQTHLELYGNYHEAQSQFDEDFASNRMEKGLTVEVARAALLLAGNYGIIDMLRSDLRINLRTLTVGWTPKRGYALLLHWERAAIQRKQPNATPLHEQTSSKSLSFAWNF